MSAAHSDTFPSEAYRAFRGDLERVATSDVTVLIEGEGGSGKTRAARVLHEASSRSAGPLVEVDLAALAPTLLEAELFGHEQGAFTGADRAREGRFRRAEGGTLVLDGVEHLQGELQVKLLRVLQERAVEPLGGEHPVPVDVRVVATSGVDLASQAAKGDFREDLYYRLAVVVLRVPALRARREDLPILAQAIGAEVAARSRVTPRALSEEALGRLLQHSWPGNVRELENALERVAVLAPQGERGSIVAAEELDFLSEALDGAAERLARSALANGLTVDDVARAMIEVSLAEQRGNLSAAARALGLSRRAFEYRMSKLAAVAPKKRTAEDQDEAREAAG